MSRQLNRLSMKYRISEELLVVKDENKLLSHFENIPWETLIDIFGNALNKFEVKFNDYVIRALQNKHHYDHDIWISNCIRHKV